MQSRCPLRLLFLNEATKKVAARSSPAHRFTTNSEPFSELHSHRILDFHDRENAHEPLSQLQRGSLLAPHTLNKVVSFCAKSASFELGAQVHTLVVKLGFGSNVYIYTALVDMYGKCGRMSEAYYLFDQMHERNVVAYNSLISGYRNVGSPEEAICLFLRMLRLGVYPTVYGVSNILVGCAQMKAHGLGKQVHCLGVKFGLGGNVVFGSNLIEMYSRCSSLVESRTVFDRMVTKNVITWTIMITGHGNARHTNEAIVLFKEMLRSGVRPNSVTYNSLLSSFYEPDHLDWGKQVHCRVILDGLESNEFIGVTLLTVYSECGGSLADFCKVCSNLYRWGQITWNAVISGYANLDSGQKAIEYFCEMRKAGMETDFFTFSSTLKAVGSFCGLEEGKQLHALVLKADYTSSVHVQNGLVSMYAKCGNIHDAKLVFLLMEKRDLISWNALLTACAHHGFGREAVEIFNQMKKTEVKPNGTTFLAVLTACSHVGLVQKGLEYFNMMRNDSSLEPPKVEHYATMVDLFGRAGHLAEAEAFINSMPIGAAQSVHKSLLSSCQIHGNKEIALRAAKKLLKLYPDDPATYVLLSNLFETGCDWVDAEEIRALMCNRGVQKIPGYCWA